MELKKLFVWQWLIFVLCRNVFGGIEIQSEVSCDKSVGKFIGEIVRDAIAKDPSRVHDVAFLSVEGQANNDVFNEVIAEIPEETVRLIPDRMKPLSNQRIRVASFIIIISDLIADVS